MTADIAGPFVQQYWTWTCPECDVTGRCRTYRAALDRLAWHKVRYHGEDLPVPEEALSER